MKDENIVIIGGVKRYVKNKKAAKKMREKENQKAVSAIIAKVYSKDTVGITIPNFMTD